MKEISERELNRLYKKFLRGNQQFAEAYDIAQRNSKGSVWLIGGYIYRNLVKEIYGEEGTHMPAEVDIDFLLEEQVREPYFPKGWELRLTSYGNPYFEKSGERIDLNSLLNFSSIIMRKLKPTITHFLTGTPMNIQSLVYDCGARMITARKVCLAAIDHRTIKVNNPETALDEAKKRGVTIEEMLRTKAEELGFRYLMPV